MVDVGVDTFFLARPPDGSARECYEAYVERLAMLRECALELAYTRVLISSTALTVLERNNASPPWSESPLDAIVQREEVPKLLYTTLSRAMRLEDVCGVKEILLDQVEVTPGTHLDERSADFREDYERFVAIIGCGLEEGRIGTPAALVVTRPLGSRIRVACAFEIIEAEAVIPVPSSMSLELDHVEDLNRTVVAPDPVSLWQEGFEREALDIQIARLRMEKEREFSFHPDFTESVETTGIRSDDGMLNKLVRACVETICHTNLGDTHRLRVDVGGGSDPIRRQADNAVAWRRDIDYEYHLHYWAIGEKIEFAAVRAHDDFSIPE